MADDDNASALRPGARSIAFRQMLQRLVSREADISPMDKNADGAAIMALPEPAVYKPYKAAFGSIGGLFLTSGSVAVELQDAVKAVGESGSAPHASAARAANAFIHAQAAGPKPSDELCISESEDTDTSVRDPFEEVRDTAARAYSVARNATDSHKPALAIVFDPDSGLPVLINISTKWAKAVAMSSVDVRKTVCDSGVIPATVHFMDRGSALSLSAAMGSAEAANELVGIAPMAQTTNSNVSARGSQDGVASTASAGLTASKLVPTDGRIEDGALVPAESVQGGKHPASKFIVQLMHAMAKHSNSGSSSAKYVSQQFLPVANGLPIPAHVTVELMNVNRKNSARYTLLLATADTAPLADPLTQAMPVLGMQAMLGRAAAGAGTHMDILSAMFANMTAPAHVGSSAANQRFGNSTLHRTHPAIEAYRRQAASGALDGTPFRNTPNRGTKRIRSDDVDSDGDSDLHGTASECTDLNTTGGITSQAALGWPDT